MPFTSLHIYVSFMITLPLRSVTTNAYAVAVVGGVCRSFQMKTKVYTNKSSGSTHSNVDFSTRVFHDVVWSTTALNHRINDDSDIHTFPGGGGVSEHNEGTRWEEMDSFWRNVRLDEMNPLALEDTTQNDLRVMEKVDLRPVMSPSKPSPVEIVKVRGKDVYVKRDDLLRLEGSHVSGNKARKMLALNQIPANDFPDCVVSYGGSQSNAMVSIAAIVHSKNREVARLDANLESRINDVDNCDTNFPIWEQESATQPSQKRFLYYTKKLPRFLKKNPSGNYFRAKALGMEMIELSNDEYNHLFGGDFGGRSAAPKNLPISMMGDALWIPQGGACGYAVPGCKLLATEILMFWSQNGNGKPLSVFVPGGTCSTAFLLHREIHRLQASNNQQMDIEVVVVPCVGDEGYAERQMMALNMATGGTGEKKEIPRVLKPAPIDSFYLSGDDEHRYFRFGEPDLEILKCFREMDAYGVKIDLLYGAPSWHVLLRHWPLEEESGGCDFLKGREIMYVHSGGLEGVNSQLMRYRHKGLIHGSEAQHPERQRRMSKVFLDSISD